MTTMDVARFARAERDDDGAQWIERRRVAAAWIAPTALAGARSGEKKGRMGTLVVGAIVAAFVLITAANGISGVGAGDARASDGWLAAGAQAAKQGDRANPLPEPYTAKGLLGGEKYSLTGRVVDADANAAVAGYNRFNEEAPIGFTYVIVELTMTGIDPDGVEPSLASFDLSLATPEGELYDSEAIAYADGMPAMSDGPTLYPGSSFTGYTAYIVPDTAESLLMYEDGNCISF
ncbi:hypothetical protein QWJ90_05435 [Microbacterium oryzae]|uniref:hypothetical protein n=1 Tax=Microbacterium oryzae TaxID=743009 RepID=UPI0025B002C7|nr:hypothetical protein [Microbacterium oryzae]MDN3310363.1 hypothetical protein [Microbacterium oryzae]